MKGLTEFPVPLGKLRQQPYDNICHLAHDLNLAPDTPFHCRRERNEQLLPTGRAILDDSGIYGGHLDRMEGAGGRRQNVVSRMGGCPAEGPPQSRDRDRGADAEALAIRGGGGIPRAILAPYSPSPPPDLQLCGLPRQRCRECGLVIFRGSSVRTC